MARGHPRPKPPSVKAVTGNPGRRPIETVELPDTGRAERPAFLRRNRRAVELWDEYGPTLEILGTLRKESAHVFAAWCALTAEFEKSPRKFTAAKLTQFRMLSSMLGMDPSAQGKFGKRKDGNQDPAEDFFAGPRLAG
jgi:phage terminase small subunit